MRRQKAAQAQSMTEKERERVFFPLPLFFGMLAKGEEGLAKQAANRACECNTDARR